MAPMASEREQLKDPPSLPSATDQRAQLPAPAGGRQRAALADLLQQPRPGPVR